MDRNFLGTVKQRSQTGAQDIKMEGLKFLWIDKCEDTDKSRTWTNPGHGQKYYAPDRQMKRLN